MSSNNERIYNSVRNLFWGGLSQVIRIIGPFAIRTIIITQLGNLYLGLNSLFTSILQALSLTELGFSGAVVYCMYKPIAVKDYEQLGKLVAFFRKVYRVIGIVIIGIGILLLPVLHYLINGEYPSETNIYVVYFVYLINAALGYFFFGYKTSVLYAFQRSDINSNVISLANILMYTAQIVVLLVFKHYYTYLIIMPIMTLASNVLRSVWAGKVLPKFNINGDLDKETKREIWKKVRALLIYKIGSTISNSADNLVISAFLGLNILAIYNNYFLIISTLFSVLGIYYDSIKASIGSCAASETVEDNYRLFNGLFFGQGWLIGFCSVMLVCLYQPFIELWTGAENLLPYSLVVLLGVYFYTWKIHDVVHIYKDALGLWHEDRFRPLLSSLVNLCLNLLFVQKIGLYGIILSTIVSELTFSLLWAPRVLFQNYFKFPILQYYKKLIKYTVTTILCGGVSVVACEIMRMHVGKLFGEGSIISFFVRAVFACLICNALYLIIYGRCEEFKMIKSVARQILKKPR